MCGCGCHLVAELAVAQLEARAARGLRAPKALSEVKATLQIPSDAVVNCNAEAAGRVARGVWAVLTGRIRQI
jgi:hypothetical protein